MPRLHHPRTACGVPPSLKGASARPLRGDFAQSPRPSEEDMQALQLSIIASDFSVNLHPPIMNEESSAVISECLLQIGGLRDVRSDGR